jgi:hypothetical protein
MIKDLEIRLTYDIENLKQRVVSLENAIKKIPDPIVIYYKPPGHEQHIKLNESLDDLYNKINKLEENL